MNEKIPHTIQSLPEKYRAQAIMKYRQKLKKVRPDDPRPQLANTAAKRGHKYGAKPVTYDGVRFASTFEGNYYLKLKNRLRRGEIRSFTRQPRFPIVVNDVKICEYWADFAVTELDGSISYIDTKGHKTAVYKLKQKLMKACHPNSPIIEVKNSK